MIKFFTYFLIFFVLLQNLHCNTFAKHSYTSETLYRDVYISNTFTSIQIIDIQDALKEWEMATNGAVEFHTVEHIDIHHKTLIIRDCSETAPKIIELDKEVSEAKNKPMIVFGYFDDDERMPVIYLVSSRISERVNYTAITEHELGHALGLSHSAQKHTIMYDDQTDAAKHLTLDDIDHFCAIHYCNLSKIE